MVLVVAGEAIALGFQHYILSLGTAVMIPTMLVPLMGGNDVRIASFINPFFMCSRIPASVSVVKCYSTLILQDQHMTILTKIFCFICFQ